MKNKEQNKWYKNCEFIHDYMQFYSYEDFIENKDFIISIFQKMDSTYKLMYQWYIWANPNIREDKKELIWDILNKIFLDSYEQD